MISDLIVSLGADKSEADKSRALVNGHACTDAYQGVGKDPNYVLDVGKP